MNDGRTWVRVGGSDVSPTRYRMPRHVKLGSIETITYQPGGYSVFQSALDEYPTVVVGTIAVSFAIGLVGGWLLRGAFR